MDCGLWNSGHFGSTKAHRARRPLPRSEDDEDAGPAWRHPLMGIKMGALTAPAGVSSPLKLSPTQKCVLPLGEAGNGPTYVFCAWPSGAPGDV